MCWNVSKFVNRFPPAWCGSTLGRNIVLVMDKLQQVVLLWLEVAPTHDLPGSAVIVCVSVEVLQQEYEVRRKVNFQQPIQGL